MAKPPRDLVRSVVTNALRLLPTRLGPYRTTLRSSIGQVYTGNPDIHYEVWRRSRLGVVELGLHFEADPLTNARLLGAFRAREAELRARLGPEPLLEAWDKGWTRIHETIPLREEPNFALSCANRIAAYVSALEPILQEELPADVLWRPVRGRVSARRRR